MKPTLSASIRYLQISLGLCFCFYFFVVAINNCLDYQSNFAFVKHVMTMDSTFIGNKLKYRSINNSFVHNFVYLTMIVWQFLVGLILAFGSSRLIKSFHRDSNFFHESKSILVIGLSLSILLWFYAFIIVGGEWFLMWQSPRWNGQSPAFNLLIINLLAIVILLYRDQTSAAETTSKKIGA